MNRINLLCIIFLAISILACQKGKKAIVPEAGFGNFVQAYTSGEISIESFITVKLNGEVPGVNMTGEAGNGELFSFSPEIKGKAYWRDNTTVEFRPDKPMQPGTVYEGKFNLGAILKVESKFRKMPFQFSTIRQSFSVGFDALKSYQGLQFEKMQITGTIITADVARSDDVQKLLNASLEGRELNILWRHHDDRKQHFFTVDSIPRKKEESVKLIFSWNGEALGVDQKETQEFEVPALNVFKIIETKVVLQPQQYISIVFSDPVLSTQDLTGMITVEGNTNLRLIVSGNEVKAWPDKPLAGVKQVTVFKGVKNVLYYGLKETETFALSFQNILPAVTLVGKGVIVPQDNNLILPFEAVSLNAVDLRILQVFRNNVLQFFQANEFAGNNEMNRFGRLVYSGKIDLKGGTPADLLQWKTYKIDIGKLIKLEDGAIYRVELRFRKEYSLYESADTATVKNTEGTEGEEAEAEESEEGDFYSQDNPDEPNTYQSKWDSPGWFSDYYRPRGFKWDERNNPNHVSYFNSERFVSRNIFSSDLGIIVKEGQAHKMVIVTTNLITAQPESDVEIQLYNFQNQLMEKITTDGKGFASIDLKKKPFLLVAKKGNRYGYLRLDDGTSLSLSTFDVSGEEIQEGIKGFIYGERGVWRPGDMMYLTFIMESEKALPDDHPVIFSLINPRGQVVEKRIETKGENGFYQFPVSTSQAAPTGNWRAEVRVGNTVFSKIIKVETVKPNRLKINFKLPELLTSTGPSTVQLESSWLHGAPARSLKAKIDVLFVKTQTSFKGFENYSFNNPGSSFSPVEQTIYEGRLDESGKTSVGTVFSGLDNAPGMIKSWFTTRVFEEGGDFSIGVSSALYAPFKRFVGVKMPGAADKWYKTDTDYEPEIVLVTADGKPAEGGTLEAKLYKVDWRWWWESGNEGLAYYASGNYKRPVLNWEIKNAKQKNTIKLNVKYHDWDDNGRYLLIVNDKNGGHTTGLVFYMSKWGEWRSEGMAEGATLLSVTTDKLAYKVGEKIEVTLPSSKNGKALVSVENGSEVTDIFWVETQDRTTRFTIDAKPEMAPNVYLHISLIQPYGQTANDAPLRLYGVVPVFVENPETFLQPVIEMAEELKPEEPYTIRVTEKNKKQMTYTLAVVDEGLLDLTSFKTPDPHAAFYAREALGVRTWDMFDFVAGAYGARLEKAFAVGGDEGLANKGKKQANRFVPVVQFAGPFTINRGSTGEHKFKMPNYVGSVRVMVVSGNQGAYGNTEKTVKVRKALMLLATLPRVLAPGEEVSLPVSVFAMKEQVKNADVRIKVNDLFTIEGSDKTSLQFSDPGEKMARFKLRVNKQTGIGKVEIEASGGGEKATYSIELDVRNPNPPVIAEKSVFVKKGESSELSVQAPGMEGSNEAWIEISGFPPLNLNKNLEYLISYPHGCIEQTVSAAFPQLFLSKLTDLTSDQKVRIDENIRQALSKLPSFQVPSGGFGYWPGSFYENDWGTSYAGHFMLKAEAAGYSIPPGVKERWLSYQRNRARNWTSSEGFRNGEYYFGYDLCQAYRLYTLALASSPDAGAMNRLRETISKNPAAAWRLGAAYILAGQPDVCRQLSANLSTAVGDYSELGGTYGSDLRDQAMILESLILLGDESKSFALLKDISDKIEKGYWLSTQTASWCLSSAALFAEKFFGRSNETSFSLNISGSQNNYRSSLPVFRIPAGIPSGGLVSVTAENRGTGSGYLRLVTKGIPLNPDTTSASSDLKLEVAYFNSAGKAVNPSQLQQGEDLKMVVKVTHPGKRLNYEEMVLSAVFPSGWEIMNKRLNDIPGTNAEVFEYQDIRDDRIYTYFDLAEYQEKTFTFYLNAAYTGRFFQAPVSCEAMYDNTIYARQRGRWVEVKSQN